MAERAHTIRPYLNDLRLRMTRDNEGSFRSDTDFMVELIAEIGPGSAGSRGGDAFYLTVCSPEAIERVTTDLAWAPRAHLIMRDYDERAVRKFIGRCCVMSSGTTWQDSAGKLLRWFHWEHGE